MRINGVHHSYISGRAKRLHEYQTIQAQYIYNIWSDLSQAVGAYIKICPFEGFLDVILDYIKYDVARLSFISHYSCTLLQSKKNFINQNNLCN